MEDSLKERLMDWKSSKVKKKNSQIEKFVLKFIWTLKGSLMVKPILGVKRTKVEGSYFLISKFAKLQ